MISEILLFLSVIAAIATFVAEARTTTRFSVGFLGLFSSLVVYLRGNSLLGSILLLTSAIALPSILASRLDDVPERPKSSLWVQLSILALYPIAALAIGSLMHLQTVDAGLVAVASVGLASLTVKELSIKVPLGLIVMSQAVLVAACLRSSPTWLMLSSEFCRLLLVTFLPTRRQRPCHSSSGNFISSLSDLLTKT